MREFTIAVAVLLFAVPVCSQPTRPQVIGSTNKDLPEATLLKWSSDYYAGDWLSFQEQVQTDLGGITIKGHMVDFTREPYMVIFTSSLRRKDGEIIRVIVEKFSAKPKDYADPYTTTLRGVEGIRELFVTTDPTEKLESFYTLTRTEDPVTSNLAAFVKQWDPGKLGPFLKLAFDAPPTSVPTKVELRVVSLPRKRAAIEVQDELTGGRAFPLSAKTLKEDAGKLHERVVAAETRLFGCATAVSAALNKAIEEFFNTAQETDRPISEELESSLSIAAAKVLGDRNSCRFPGDGGATDKKVLLERQNARSVEDEYRKLVRPAARLIAKNTFANVPVSHVTLGVLAAVMTDAEYTDTRVKVNNAGMLVADPLSGALSAALINYHPFGFDSTRERITWGERVRLFVGPVLTPELGVTAGFGVAFIRGLSLNVGGATLRINTPGEGESVDKAVNNKADPFGNGRADVVIVGLGYNFK